MKKIVLTFIVLIIAESNTTAYTIGPSIGGAADRDRNYNMVAAFEGSINGGFDSLTPFPWLSLGVKCRFVNTREYLSYIEAGMAPIGAGYSIGYDEDRDIKRYFNLFVGIPIPILVFGRLDLGFSVLIEPYYRPVWELNGFSFSHHEFGIAVKYHRQ